MKLEHYHEIFQAQVDLLEELEVTIMDEAVVRTVEWDYTREVPNVNDQVEARNQGLVVQFIQGTNVQYKGFLCHLQNSFLDGDDLYPPTVQ